jgi:hypothetical protein
VEEDGGLEVLPVRKPQALRLIVVILLFRPSATPLVTKHL